MFKQVILLKLHEGIYFVIGYLSNIREIISYVNFVNPEGWCGSLLTCDWSFDTRVLKIICTSSNMRPCRVPEITRVIFSGKLKERRRNKSY
jgi:hypothetical protein